MPADSIKIRRVLAKCMRLTEFVKHPDWKPKGTIQLETLQSGPSLFADVPHPSGRLEVFIQPELYGKLKGQVEFRVKDGKGKLTHHVLLNAEELKSELLERTEEGRTKRLKPADSLALGLILRTVMPNLQLPSNLSSNVKTRFEQFIHLVRQHSDAHPE